MQFKTIIINKPEDTKEMDKMLNDGWRVSQRIDFPNNVVALTLAKQSSIAKAQVAAQPEPVIVKN